MKQAYPFFSLLFFLIFLSACGSYDTPENLSSDDFVPVKINNQYQISLPDYMSKTDQLNDEASLQFMHGFKEAYAMVLDEPKADFEEMVPILEEEEEGEGNFTMATLDYYVDIQLESFKSAVVFDGEPTREKTTINGLKAELCEMSGTIDGIGIKYYFGFFESDKDLYMAILWTLKEREVHFEETFLTSLKSFKVLNQ